MNPNTPAPKKRTLLNVGNVAALLVATSLVGQVLGFLRTKLVNANFDAIGASSTDSYFAAFVIPDFFFFTLAAGALGVAFMPVLADHLEKNDRKGVWELSTSLMNLLALVMFAVGFITFLFASPLIHIVAPRLEGKQLSEAVTILRLLSFNPLLFTISGVITSVQQTMGRFFFYAIAPLFYNLSIIVSIYAFRDNIGLVGLGIGALLGAILQLLVVLVGNQKLNFHWHPRINWQNADFKLILKNLPPRSLDQGIDQLNSMVETNLASRIGQGNITYYSNAYTLSTAPILLVGTAISTAAFPRLNQRLSQGRPDLFRKDFLKILRAMIWISVPIIVTCFFARGYLARLIYSRGSQEIALIFGFLTFAIFFRITYSLISRWFYAQKDTKTPLFVSVFTIGLNMFLAYSLARPSVYGIAGLAIAQSAVAAIEVAILSVIMVWRDRKLFDRAFFSGVWRIISVTGFSVVAGYVAVAFYPLGALDRGFLTLGSKLIFIASVIFGTHVALSALFGLEEVRPIFRKIKQITLKPLNIS